MKKIARKNIQKDIILEDIVALIREVTLSSYGVVGIANLSKKEGKVEEGLYVSLAAGKTIEADIYIVADQDVKITETIRSCQESIVYKLKSIFPQFDSRISVFAHELFSRN